MSKITVVNKYRHDATSDDIYIGRGSIFGSPYSHLTSKFEGVTKCDTREEAVQKYENYFNAIMSSCGCKHKQFKNSIRDLVIKLNLGEDINLVCYCKPKACHGDIIKEYILKQIKNDT